MLQDLVIMTLLLLLFVAVAEANQIVNRGYFCDENLLLCQPCFRQNACHLSTMFSTGRQCIDATPCRAAFIIPDGSALTVSQFTKQRIAEKLKRMFKMDASRKKPRGFQETISSSRIKGNSEKRLPNSFVPKPPPQARFAYVIPGRVLAPLLFTASPWRITENNQAKVQPTTAVATQGHRKNVQHGSHSGATYQPYGTNHGYFCEEPESICQPCFRPSACRSSVMFTTGKQCVAQTQCTIAFVVPNGVIASVIQPRRTPRPLPLIPAPSVTRSPARVTATGSPAAVVPLRPNPDPSIPANRLWERTWFGSGEYFCEEGELICQPCFRRSSCKSTVMFPSGEQCMLTTRCTSAFIVPPSFQRLV